LAWCDRQFKVAIIKMLQPAPVNRLDYVWVERHVWCVALTCWFADPHRQLWNGTVGRKGRWLFSRQKLTGTGFSPAGHREAFHGLEVQCVTGLSCVWCSIFYFLQKNKKEKGVPGQTCPSTCDMLGFSQLLGTIKSCFTNTVILLDMGHTKGRTCTGGIRKGKEN
jgi:hypothetical protein